MTDYPFFAAAVVEAILIGMLKTALCVEHVPSEVISTLAKASEGSSSNTSSLVKHVSDESRKNAYEE